MDFTALNQYFVAIVMVACLIVGYLIKHTSFLARIPNGDIPFILAVIGGILNIFVSGLSIESIIYGALTGLASTGLHQAFKNFVENNKAE